MSYFGTESRKCPIEPQKQSFISSPSPFRYNPNNKLSKPAHSIAPFGSTSRLNRSVNSNSKTKQNLGLNPNRVEPFDQYDQIASELNSIVPRQENKHSSVFVSNTQRFEQENKYGQTPGPGQYQIANSARALTTKSKSMYALKKSQTLLKDSINHSALMKVPSIPSDHLGYKEDAQNVMRKVEKLNQGEPHPGSYEVRTNLLSKTQGFKWKPESKKKPKVKHEMPGPGKYQYELKSAQKASVVSFKSATERFQASSSKKLMKPGPGSYNPQSAKKISHCNNQEGNFNSKTSRFDRGGNGHNVGPGQYFNPIKQRLKSKSVSSLRNKNQQKTQQFVPHKKTIFEAENQVPGPGQYANISGMTFKLQKDLFRKFNETTLPQAERKISFPGCSEQVVNPGPGNYIDNRENSEDKRERPPGLTKASGGKIYKKTEIVNLKEHQEEEITPSPFDYNIFNNTIASKLQKASSKLTLTDSKPFGLGAERFKHYNHEVPTRSQGRPSQTYGYAANMSTVDHHQAIGESRLQDDIVQIEKKVKKLIMTNVKIKVPFGSSATKSSKQAVIGESPGKFYGTSDQWVKKSHNIRSKM